MCFRVFARATLSLSFAVVGYPVCAFATEPSALGKVQQGPSDSVSFRAVPIYAVHVWAGSGGGVRWIAGAEDSLLLLEIFNQGPGLLRFEGVGEGGLPEALAYRINGVASTESPVTLRAVGWRLLAGTGELPAPEWAAPLGPGDAERVADLPAALAAGQSIQWALILWMADAGRAPIEGLYRMDVLWDLSSSGLHLPAADPGTRTDSVVLSISAEETGDDIAAEAVARARRYWAQGRRDESVRELEIAARRAPSSGLAWAALASYRQLGGDVQGALAALKELQRAMAASPEARRIAEEQFQVYEKSNLDAQIRTLEDELLATSVGD